MTTAVITALRITQKYRPLWIVRVDSRSIHMRRQDFHDAPGVLRRVRARCLHGARIHARPRGQSDKTTDCPRAPFRLMTCTWRASMATRAPLALTSGGHATCTQRGAHIDDIATYYYYMLPTSMQHGMSIFAHPVVRQARLRTPQKVAPGMPGRGRYRGWGGIPRCGGMSYVYI